MKRVTVNCQVKSNNVVENETLVVWSRRFLTKEKAMKIVEKKYLGDERKAIVNMNIA